MLKTVAAQGAETKWWEAKAAPIKSDTKSIQTITFSTGTFNDKDRTFVAIASTPLVDRYGDTIMQEGWVLDNFLKNPVVPWAHDYWQPPVARAIEIGVNSQGYLQFKYQAPPEGLYPFADTIWNLYRNQFMFAFSVGFSSIESEGDWSEGYNFMKCELLEISAVVVPANPGAVALAFDGGFIDQPQLKELKNQIADSLKNIDKLIERSTGAKDEKDADSAKDASQVGTISVKVQANTDEVKGLLSDINDASKRLEAATKAAQELKASSDAEGLTSTDHIDNTTTMSTKAGAALSKANKDKLRACHKALTDMKAMCDEHILQLTDMIGDEAEGEKAVVADVETKAAADEGQATEATEAVEAEASATEGTEAKEDEQQLGDANAEGKGEGEVNSGAGDANEGADQGEAEEAAAAEEVVEASEGDELVDPDNITPEQAAKVAAAVNEELEKVKQ